MPPFGPIRRIELIQALRRQGFTGPYSGGKHQFMLNDSLTLRIPNPHRDEIGRDLLARILKQAGIDLSDWEKI